MAPCMIFTSHPLKETEMTTTDALCYAITTALRPTPTQEWLVSLRIPDATPVHPHHLSPTKESFHEHD